MKIQNTIPNIRGTETNTLQCYSCIDAEYNFFSTETAESELYKFSVKNGEIKCFDESWELILPGTRHQSKQKNFEIVVHRGLSSIDVRPTLV